MGEKLFKVVSSERESYIAEFLKCHYDSTEYIYETFLDILRFLRFHNFIKKYEVGTVVEAKEGTAGLFAYKTYNGALQCNNLHIKGKGKIIEVEAIGPILNANQYWEHYRDERISSIDLRGFQSLVEKGQVDRDHRNVLTMGVVVPKVRVLT